MESELGRLNSFNRNWPVSSKPSTLKLALAGFFYTGKGDECKCFSCGQTFCNWDATDCPYAVHLISNINCPFIRGQEYSASPKVNDDTTALNMQLRFSHKFNFTNTSVYNQVRTCPSRKVFPCQEPHWLFERERKESFNELDDGELFEKFAAAGFFYNKEKNIIVCAFCRNELQLSETDCYNACVLHRSRFPDCPFICGFDVGDVSIIQEMEIKEKICAIQCRLSNVARRLNFTAIESLPSMFPEYTEEADRVLSYKMWPKVLANELPQSLAEAGFFYLGTGDVVACFCCDLILSDWRTGDKPLLKHIKRKPDCPYMMMIKENNMAVIDNMNSTSDSDSEMLSQSSESSDVESRTSESTSESDPCEDVSSDQHESSCEQSEDEFGLSPESEFGWRRKTYLSSDVIQYARKKGYTPEQIKNGILEFYKMSSGYFPDAQALAMTIEKKLECSKRVDELRGNLNKVMEDRRKVVDTCREQLKNNVQRCKQEVQNKDQMLQKATQDNGKLTQDNGKLKHDVGKLREENANLTDKNSQLQEMLAQLMRENQQLRNNSNKEVLEECDNLTRKVQCKVCLNNELDSVLLPCRHMVCCQSCSQTIMNNSNKCPTCRTNIHESIDVHLS